ncbi:MAG: cytochrome c-type biogenesis protein CcmH [Anaerolineae bacterium]|nr:cytochrome c-type biogenesis protein CcmH [Anaerolineae bacterium]
MMKAVMKTVLIALFLLSFIPAVSAQMSGEELPPGVTAEDVYQVSNKMYCEVCAGVPLSDCPSVTCRAWRQEIARLLGEGYSDSDIKSYFAENYGSAVTGVPLKTEDRNIGLGLPALVIVLAGIVIGWRMLRLYQRGETRALQAARAAGLRSDYDRPVPDNVDSEALQQFMRLVEEKK